MKIAVKLTIMGLISSISYGILWRIVYKSQKVEDLFMELSILSFYIT